MRNEFHRLERKNGVREEWNWRKIKLKRKSILRKIEAKKDLSHEHVAHIKNSWIFKQNDDMLNS